MPSYAESSWRAPGLIIFESWISLGYSCETRLVVTTHDPLNFYDQNKQVDTVILDFSIAVDTVPHRKLLHKLEAYRIRGPIL